MRSPFRRSRGPDETAAAEALRGVRDGLRSGQSLRRALLLAAEADGSPIGHLAQPLAGGRPIATTLHDAARTHAAPDLSFALLVLAVQAESGGDPIPCVRGLEDRLRRRAAATREARTLTTQARMSARAIYGLTPGFLLLFTALDPTAMWAALGAPAARLALAAGLVLQLLGGWWISRIVGANTRTQRPSPAAGIPVVRAVTALFVGRRRPEDGVAEEVVRAADALALVLGSGLSPSRGLELVAPTVRGPFGDALRRAVAATRAGSPSGVALAGATRGFEADEVGRFVRALEASERLGVPLADTMRTLADEIRDAESARVSEEVRRASVRVLLPLGLLILPAFILACLVPLFLSGLEGIAL